MRRVELLAVIEKAIVAADLLNIASEDSVPEGTAHDSPVDMNEEVIVVDCGDGRTARVAVTHEMEHAANILTDHMRAILVSPNSDEQMASVTNRFAERVRAALDRPNPEGRNEAPLITREGTRAFSGGASDLVARPDPSWGRRPNIMIQYTPSETQTIADAEAEGT
jgi:hypothetical protein